MLDLLTSPNTTDIAYKWIQVLFPTDASSPYAAALATFSGMLTFIGSLLLGWHVLQGIVMSAYTGKVLGQKFHQIWAPLRVVLGFGLLVPISGGFSSVHFLLRDVVGVAAVQMGNAPIRAYIEATTAVDYDANGVPKARTLKVTATKGRVIYDEVLKREICNAVQYGLSNSVWSFFTNGLTGRIKLPPPGGEDSGLIPGLTATAGDYTWDYGYCGSITFEIPTSEEVHSFAFNATEMNSFAAERKVAMERLVRSVRASINGPGLADYFSKHDISDMKSTVLLEQLRTEGILKPGLAASKDAAVKAYDAAVSAAASKIYAQLMLNSGAELSERINKFGFMAAGSFERALAKASSAVVATSNASPIMKTPDLSKEFSGPYQAAVAAVIGGPKSAGEPDGNGAMLGMNGNDDPVSTVLAWISPSVHAMQNRTESETRDPVGDMMTFGHNLISIWETGISAFVALRAVAVGLGAMSDSVKDSATGFFTFGGSAILAVPAAIFMDLVNFAQSWISPLFVIILVVGILHAFVLPMLPMMMVFVMGVSWLIMFLEAAIAGILWAFVFIRMDGEDFVDRAQAQGASLLFNLFLRPAIGMLAFIGGLILLPVLMDSLTILWEDGFSAQTSHDLLWFIQWIVGVVLYTWMQWHLSLRLFGLIPTIADRVGSWMGMQSHGYNDGQETSAVVGAAVAAGSVGRTLAKKPMMHDHEKRQQQKAEAAKAAAAAARNQANSGK